MLPEYRDKLVALVAAEPDLTPAEIREKLAMLCTIPAVHYALAALGLHIEKDAPCSRTKSA